MSNPNHTTEAFDIFAIPELSEPLFKNVVTLDPSEVEAKWDLLSTDILPLQLANLNKIVLLALAATLKERKLFDDGPKTRKNEPHAKRKNA